MSSSLSGYRGPAGGSLSGGTAGSNLRGNVVPKGYKQGQLQQFTPEQMDLFQNLFSQVSPGSYLSRLAGGDESAFAPQEALAQKDYQGALGQLGSRFSQLAPGAMSAQKGSGFKNTANQAAQDFALNLSSRRQDMQRQALMDLHGISNSLLGQRPYEQFLTEKKQPFWKELLSSTAGGFGQALGSLPMLAL